MKDTISFNIPGTGLHTITPLSVLPTITDLLVIDGYTQPGSSPNTLAVGDNSLHRIELNGNGAAFKALIVTAGNSTVRGLVINNFNGNGSTVAITLQTNGGNTVQGCFLGLNAAGTAAATNRDYGVDIESSPNNVIGGTTPAARNVISGNNTGILVNGPSSSGTTIQGNYIGVNVAGTAALTSGGVSQSVTGILIGLNGAGTGSSNNTIGGATAAARNVVSGNASNNVFLNDPPSPAIRFKATTSARTRPALQRSPNGNTSEFSAALGQLLNISTRLRVGTGENALIGGFIITGADPKQLLVRAIGPSLSSLNIPGALQDPVLELHDASSTIGTNDNWKIRENGTSQQAEIAATTIPPTDDFESALLRTLPGGAASYTAIVRGKNDTTGVGLVEVYTLERTANSRLANISTRGRVETNENVMIGGFIVGEGTLKVIVRAIGPSLAARGVQGSLQDPTLELHDGNGATIATNDNWKLASDNSSQQAEIEASTIPPPGRSGVGSGADISAGELHGDCARRERNDRRCAGGSLRAAVGILLARGRPDRAAKISDVRLAHPSKTISGSTREL